jgi:hypothetical protein
MRPRRCYPAPIRTDRPRTFGYPCCGPCRFAGYRRHPGRRPRDSVEELVWLHLIVCSRSSYVSGKLELILLVLRGLNLNTGPHGDPSDELLADEVPDLNLPAVGLLVLLQVDVDGETERGVSLACESIDQSCARPTRPAQHFAVAEVAVLLSQRMEKYQACRGRRGIREMGIGARKVEHTGHRRNAS